MTTWSRRRFLATSAVAAVAAPALARATSGPDRATLEEPVFEMEGLDPAHDGLRIAQLSDVHVGYATPVERVRAAIDSINDAEPDLVVLTGDYLTHAKSGLGLMKEQLGGIKPPTVAILGNHDHWVAPVQCREVLEGLGYCVLQNENTTFDLEGAPFTVVGIDDLRTRSADPREAFKGAADGSRLVLAHVPHTADYLADFDAPLVLSGHTHGGQINIPGFTDLLLRGVLRENYARGTFQVSPKTKLYVNRGLGEVGISLRFRSPAELTMMTLRAAEPA
jgi:predicted MPP superfamily phosphohydrolase